MKSQTRILAANYTNEKLQRLHALLEFAFIRGYRVRGTKAGDSRAHFNTVGPIRGSTSLKKLNRLFVFLRRSFGFEGSKVSAFAGLRIFLS
jgi:hypothetical protein